MRGRRSRKPIHPTPAEQAERAAEFEKLGIEAPRLRIDPDRFMDSEQNRALLHPTMDGNLWADEVRRALITEQLRRRASQRKGGRPAGAKDKRTAKLHRDFDRLYRENPDIPAEDVRTMKAPLYIRKMKPKTVANHWSAAKQRARK